MKRIQFPHFSRLFSASIYSRARTPILWAGLAACIITNIQMRSAYHGELDTITTTVSSPQDKERRTALAGRFLEAGFPAIAGELYQSVAEQQPGKTEMQVLGDSVKTLDYWERIIGEKPAYRDAYFQAAKSAIELKKWDMARNLIQKAQTLDPNNRQATVLLSILQKER